jgi:hypothetical protein
MSVYGLTELNDCDNVTGFTDSNKAPSLNTTVGQRYEGTGSIETQHTNTAGGDELDTTQISGGGGTFSVDMSDRTMYVQLKDNLVDTYANQGIMAVLGDGTDKVGFQMGGNNAPGMPVPPFYNVYKFDASNLPSGSNTTFTGVEGNLTLTAITAMGIGTVHLAKAVGNVANVFCDRIAYIANDSYALRINGGTSGTPETMADVAGDDITNGWGLIGNPLGNQYIFFGPTEFGEPAASADSYFTASGEQWFWVGDNQGGHAVGATHFPFRVIGNATDTISFVLNGVVIVNTGTPAQFDISDTNITTCELDLCTLDSLGAIELPDSTITSGFTTNCSFLNCGIITSNGADMSGSKVLTPNISANEAGLVWNENADPDGELDNMTFTKTSGTAHHAIEFGTGIPTTSITLRGCAFGTDFSASENTSPTAEAGDETFAFRDTTGTLTVNLVGCTGNFGYYSAGVAITIIADPVTTLLNVKDNEGNNEQDVQVWLGAKDATDELPFEQAITSITQGAGSPWTRTVTFTAAHGLKTGDYLSLAGITNATGDNSGAFQVTVTTTTVCTYTSADAGETTFTGTITGTGGVLYGTTDASGNISTSRVWAADQLVVGRARKSSASPRFKTIELDDTILSASGLTLNRRLQLDE